NPNLPVTEPFRAAPTPHKGRLNLERTETHKQKGTKTKEVAGYNESGQVLHNRTYGANTDIDANAALPNGATVSSDLDVYADNESPYARGQYKTIKRTDSKLGDAENATLTYEAAASGGEK